MFNPAIFSTSLSTYAEDATKVIGFVVLATHHGKLWWRKHRKKKQCVTTVSDEELIAKKQQQAFDDRFVQSSVLNVFKLQQQIEAWQAKYAVQELTVMRLTADFNRAEQLLGDYERRLAEQSLDTRYWRGLAKGGTLHTD